MARLSVELQRFFFEEERPAQVKLAEILGIAEERLFGFLFVVLALPSALPIPAPGYSIPFGIVMFLLAAQLVWGAKIPWLPQRVHNYQLELKQVQQIAQKGIPFLRRIEAIARPRLSYICTSLLGRGILGSAIALMAILMMIPIPGTNTLPAIGILITGFGLVEDDGAISLAGLVVCLIALIVSISIIGAVVWGGVSLVDLIQDWLRR